MSALRRLGINPSVIQTANPSTEQSQTREAFGFKWAKRDTYESSAVAAKMKSWLFERYCGGDSGLLSTWLEGGRKIILDAGCGSGHSGQLFFGEHLRNHDYLGVDISNAVEVAKVRFEEAGFPGEFLQSDLLTAPIPDASLDMIFSEGVLHHTDSTERAIKTLARKLRNGGRFRFYVYAKKAVIREFTDDFIRNELRQLSDEKAWKALEPLSKLESNSGS